MRSMVMNARLTLLVCLLALVTAFPVSARPAGFGAVGLDRVIPSGRLYDKYGDKQVPLEPSFRAGKMVGFGLAVGAEITLVGTFPSGDRGSPFTNTPVFSFGPDLSWFAPRSLPLVQPYARAGVGYYHVTSYHRGLRIGLAAGGCLRIPTLPVSPGLEAGWYHDRLTNLLFSRTDTGNLLYFGFRLMGFD